VRIDFTPRQLAIFYRLMQSTRDVTEDYAVLQTCNKVLNALASEAHTKEG
jgi:hypothetical protein